MSKINHITGATKEGRALPRRRVLQGMTASAALAAGLGGVPGRALAADPKLGVVSFPGPSISAHSKVIIKKAGLDKKHGWELDWAIRPTSDAYYNDFVTGAFESVDFGGLNVFANLFNKGVPLKVIQATCRWPWPIVARADSNIRTIADLKGKKLGLDRASLLYGYMTTIARNAGFDLEKDTQLTNVGFFQALPRLQRGEFDAANMLFEHAIQLSIDAPKDFRLVFDAGAEFAKAIGARSAFQYQAIRTDWLQKNPGALDKILPSYRDLSQLVTNTPEEAVKMLAIPREQGGASLPEAVGRIEYVTGTDTGLKTQWVSQLARDMREEIKRELDVYVKAGLIEKMPGDDFIYTG